MVDVYDAEMSLPLARDLLLKYRWSISEHIRNQLYEKQNATRVALANVAVVLWAQTRTGLQICAVQQGDQGRHGIVASIILLIQQVS